MREASSGLDHSTLSANRSQARFPTALWLSALMALAAAVRLSELGRKSFWLDECASSLLAHADRHTFATALAKHQANMALYYVLLRGWVHFGNTEVWLRLLSVLFGVAAIPAIYAVAREILGFKAARLAAVLMTIHVFHVQYSQEARGYSLEVFFALLSCFFFLRLPASATKSTVVAYALASVLMVYAHIFGALVLLSQWLYAFVGRSATHVRRIVGLASCAIVLACLPLAISLLFSDRSQLSWIKSGLMANLWQFGTDLGGGSGLLLILYAVLLFMSLRGRLRSAGGQTRVHGAYVFLWLWLLLPILLGAISVWRPIVQSRYLIICLPPFLILAADGLAQIRSSAVSIVASVGVVALSLAALFAYYRTRADARNDDWRGATIYYLAQAQPGDAILFPYSAEEISFRDYLNRLQPGTGPAMLPQKTDLELLTTAGTWTTPEVASDAASQYKRVWVITALQPSEHDEQIVGALSAHLNKSSSRAFGFVTLRAFAVP